MAEEIQSLITDEHRAQIGTMLGQMGLNVPPTDLVVYLSERG